MACIQIIFSTFRDSDINNKRVRYSLLDYTFRTEMWQCMKSQVNNLLLHNKH